MAFKPKTHLRTSIFIAKLASASLLLLSLTVFTTKLAVPFANGFLVATLPSVVASLRVYLAPPYLFVTVNFIILTIWKLSERTNPSNGSEPTSQIALSKPNPVTQIPKQPPLPPPEPAPAAPATEPEDNPPPPAAMDNTLSMDATWKKITAEMRRAETFKERRSPAPVPAMRRSETFRDGRPEMLQMGDDELKRQFEAFIKKVNDQMRLPSPLPPRKLVHQDLRRQPNPQWEYYL